MNNKKNLNVGTVIGIAMSQHVLKNKTSFGRKRNVGILCENERPLWKDLLLVTVPTFIGSVMPILVAHFLSPQEGGEPGTPHLHPASTTQVIVPPVTMPIHIEPSQPASPVDTFKNFTARAKAGKV
jgi:hypothetical protein